MPNAGEVAWRSVAAQVGRAVVTFRVIAADGQPRQGLGLLADPNGFVLTSAALVDDCRAATAIFADNSSQRLQPAVTMDPRRGLAAFRIQPVALEPVVQCPRVPVAGTPLALVRVGAPSGPEASVLVLKRPVERSEVLVRLGKPPENPTASLLGLDAATWLELEGPIVPDDRGGPVFNAAGELVGLLVWSDGTRNAHFAVPADAISALLERARDVAARPPPPEPTSPSKPPQPLSPSGGQTRSSDTGPKPASVDKGPPGPVAPPESKGLTGIWTVAGAESAQYAIEDDGTQVTIRVIRSKNLIQFSATLLRRQNDPRFLDGSAKTARRAQPELVHSTRVLGILVTPTALRLRFSNWLGTAEVRNFVLNKK